MQKYNCVVVLGPTAVGKTSIGVQLAYKFGGEIISADSRQTYRGLDLGSGKDLDEYTRYIGNLQVGEWIYKCKLNKPVKEGIYGANIIIESISPMKFIVN